MNYESMTVPELEAEVNRRDAEIQAHRKAMIAIQQVIARKNDHWMRVGRFEGWSDERKAAFHALRQGVGAQIAALPE